MEEEEDLDALLDAIPTLQDVGLSAATLAALDGKSRNTQFHDNNSASAAIQTPDIEEPVDVASYGLEI